MKVRRLVSSVAVAGMVGGMALAGGPAQAACTGGRVPPRVVEVPAGPAGTYYVDIRHIASEEYDFSIWLYQEANGVTGLQRGTRTATAVSEGDTSCPDHWGDASDAVIW